MDYRRPTVQMLGRFQPWHRGHTELFKRAFKKTGQVAILVRDTGETAHSRLDLINQLKDEGFEPDRDFCVIDVPNIVDIVHGRDVGYTISEIRLDATIESISATQIREAREDTTIHS